MKRIDEIMAAVRANPRRFAAWVVLLVAVAAVGVTVGDALGLELYLFTT